MSEKQTFEQGGAGASPAAGDPRQQHGILPASPSAAWAILAVLACMAALSLLVAVREALITGIDFQWSGAHLIGEHLDPWKIMLEGDPAHLIRPGQTPNYLHELYIFLLPTGYLSLPHALAVWCAANLIMLAATLWLVIRMFALDRMHAILLTLLVLSSTPFRMTLSNGQHGIFCLLMMTLVFYLHSEPGRGLFLGISYSKYSFSPLLVFFLLLKRRFTLLLASAIAPAIGLFLVWLFLRNRLGVLALEPFKLSRYGVGFGYGDVMTAIEMILHSHGYSLQRCNQISTAVGMSAAMISAFAIARAKGIAERAQFAMILLLTLFCFKHLLYDYVVLLVPAALLMRAAKSMARTLALLGILYFWFFTTILNRLEQDIHPLTILCNGIILIATTVFVAKASAGMVFPADRAEG
jgi:hypothetical protein